MNIIAVGKIVFFKLHACTVEKKRDRRVFDKRFDKISSNAQAD